MGSSNPHPHCQIWATGHVPDEPLLEGQAQLAYLQEHGTTLLADYLAQELTAGGADCVQQRCVCGSRSVLGGVAV